MTDESLSAFAAHMQNKPTLLFVYGTLKQNQPANYLLGGMEYVGACSVPGVLLHLGPYPGLLDHALCRVTGEVYRVNWRTLVGSLDHYEQVHAGLYTRRQVKVPFEPGVAWTYYKNLPAGETLTDKTLVVDRGVWTHPAAGRVHYPVLLDYFQHQRWREPANRTGPQPIIGAVPEHIEPAGRGMQDFIKNAQLPALPPPKEAPKPIDYKDIVVDPGIEIGENAL